MNGNNEVFAGLFCILAYAILPLASVALVSILAVVAAYTCAIILTGGRLYANVLAFLEIP